MFVPTICTRTTNLELTKERRVHIIKKLLSLGQYIADPQSMHIDVVMRQSSYASRRKQYYLSAKLVTYGKTFVTVAISPSFKSAVAQVRKRLKQQIESELVTTTQTPPVELVS